MKTAQVVAVALVALVCLTTVQAKYKEGKANMDNGSSKPMFKFLTKFCYSNKPGGTGSFTYSNNLATPGTAVVMLYDSQWKNIWKPKNWDRKKCQEIVATAQQNAYGHVPIPTGPNFNYSITFGNLTRPRFWYFAALNCENTGLDLKFTASMINPGGIWIRQFSVDEQHMLTTYLIFFMIFLVGGVTHIYGLITLWRQDSVHPIIKLLTSSIMMEVISIFCEFIHLAVYSGNGVGAPVMDGISQVLDMAAQLCFMCLLILISKGWTISSPQLTDRRLLFIILSVFLFGYVGLFIWETAGKDPASTNYVYESIPGIIILVVRMLTWLWFLWNLRHTFTHETHPDKRKFYLVFGFMYSLWFIALPVIVGIATVLDPWVRMKVIQALYLLFQTAGMTGLGYLLWPSRAHEYFKITAPDLLAGSTPYDKI